MKIGFVILHYLTTKLTLNCIDSIITNIDTENWRIIVVDNGSNDGSGRKLQEAYSDNEKIKVIICDQNLGFAKGNNVGFQYAKEVEKCDFICMLNNDTLLQQNGWEKKIAAEYQKFHSAVIGPAIILSDDFKIVEARKIGERYRYQRERRNIIIAYLLLHIGVDITLLLKLCRKIVPLELNAYYPIEIKDKHVLDVVLPGCCWIFTPTYIRQFDGIDDRTFMYREEELLYIRLKKHNMQSLYSENLEIKHLGGATTNAIYSMPRKRKLFCYKNEIRSLKILIDEMRGGEKIK